MLVKQSDWDLFYANILRKTKLDLNQYKANQLQRRIVSLAEHRGFRSLNDFWGWVDADANNVQSFLDHLAINVSELFRNPEKWTELQTKIIPELLKQNQRLKIWSAGCSYGAEAHTMAILLQSHFPGSHTVLGSDIDQAALNQANRGEFADSDVRGIPKQYQQYLAKQGTNWIANQDLKKYLKFQKLNLLGDRFESNFDLIMCRNVVIYFTEEAKDELYKRFYASLRPGGYLFVGSTERIFKSAELGFETPYPFFYRKPLQEEKKWRNAS
ncbi:MAG: protein-glutamate O-methyltransferase CheR [Fimbriimonadaceae bacterium]|jgi:chemotaxis protein methyltransferase CheR|nr:protein-glutamate O-methyltransferase CheR [Fimbriimonadaceae bacterium]